MSLLGGVEFLFVHVLKTSGLVGHGESYNIEYESFFYILFK